MDQAMKDLITVSLAAWGAVTGSTAIFIQVRQFRKDRAHLKVHAELELRPAMPPKSWIRVTVTNRGRRPATTLKLWVQIRPAHWWLNLPWNTWKNRVALDSPKEAELLEGRSVAFIVTEERVPVSVDLGRAKALIVEDTVGRLWYSAGIKGQEELLARRELAPFRSDKFILGERHAMVELYKFSEKDCIVQARYGIGSTQNERVFHTGCKSVLDVYAKIKRKAELFASGEVATLDLQPHELL